MLRRRLASIRGQLVLWYLAVLAILLTAMGIFLATTVSSYLRTSTASSMRHTALQNLTILGPCYVKSTADLQAHAQTLAQLLGGYDTAVTIVSPTGQTLANHGTGPLGHTQPLRLTAATIQSLLRTARTSLPPALPRVAVSACPQRPIPLRPHHHVITKPTPLIDALVGGGNIMLVAVPLGPSDQPFGYAILGRSTVPAQQTVTRVLKVFALSGVAALLIAALIALPLINRALRPLRQVTLTAEAIAAGDFEQRARLAHSKDEIGRLGEAFNSMVDRLQAAIAVAAASEQRMRRFLADASHELRTPATVLRGASQVLLLQGETERPEVVTALRDMHEEAVRMARLVDDLLTLSRIDAGQQLAPQPVEVRSFLQEFVQRHAAVWPQRSIRLEAQALNGATAYVDPEALRRVLTNLVDNAARYSRSEGDIRVAGSVPDPTSVSLAVIDEGPGLPASELDRIFDRFYRSDEGRSRDSGGTGLGLAIVRGLVEQSGGNINIDTAPDRGTTVTVTLPRAGRQDA